MSTHPPTNDSELTEEEQLKVDLYNLANPPTTNVIRDIANAALKYIEKLENESR